MKKMRIVLVFLLFVFSITLPGYAGSKSVTQAVVMIIAENNFQDDELFQPKKVLEENGIRVVVASSSLLPAKGMLGGQVIPDMLVKDIKAADFQAVIFIGGSGASQYWTDQDALALARNAMAAKRIVAAICIAPVTLAKAGILKGRRVTAWPQAEEELKSQGILYTGKPVEKDGNIITGSGPAAAKQFGEEIVKALLKK